jgi:hypothetical protein
MDVQQMMGRAGRPQYNTTGVAHVISLRDQTTDYKVGLDKNTNIYSTMPDHSATYVLPFLAKGLVTTPAQLVGWVRNTLYATTLSPMNQATKVWRRNEVLQIHFAEIAVDCQTGLEQAQWVYRDSLTPTKMGEVACRFMLGIGTGKTWTNIVGNYNHVVKNYVYALLGADEFVDVSARPTFITEDVATLGMSPKLNTLQVPTAVLLLTLASGARWRQGERPKTKIDYTRHRPVLSENLPRLMKGIEAYGHALGQWNYPPEVKALKTMLDLENLVVKHFEATIEESNC